MARRFSAAIWGGVLCSNMARSHKQLIIEAFWAVGWSSGWVVRMRSTDTSIPDIMHTAVSILVRWVGWVGWLVLV